MIFFTYTGICAIDYIHTVFTNKTRLYNEINEYKTAYLIEKRKNAKLEEHLRNQFNIEFKL